MAFTIDYDLWIHLDAEDLAETGIAEAYERLLPELLKYVSHPPQVEEVIDHPQIKARGAIQELDTPYGRLRFAGSGFKLAHGGGRLDRMAPELSADTDAVLDELGFDAAEIAALRAREIV